MSDAPTATLPADEELLAGAPAAAPAARAVELWGGVECTLNRVGDQYLDQVEQSGHASRVADLDLFHSLGIQALRYPVLWEKTAPDGPQSADWQWADERLGCLRALGIRPIVGLVHHGSGPPHTSLIDPGFPDGLARYAGAVAERFPWVDAYTPVNEPLTTARFSGLYGHWYPHRTDGLSFARGLLIECKATVLAMREIRKANPEAQLVQTEDLGKVYSTPGLSYQADFENLRRWLTWDLLCGRVGRDHPMWRHFVRDGVPESEVGWFLDNPCPPDVLGINYYVTSERFLDHRLDRYPEQTHGGNAFERYADVEAVRVSASGIGGASLLLREAWERYGIPVAVTEAHLGCTREEQVRWLVEVWNSARELRDTGVDVRAVTAWSLLGAFDWNSLLTRWDGRYETGVFDIRGGDPRPTALARAMADLSSIGECRHPVLSTPGWWRRPERLLYPAVHLGSGVGVPVRGIESGPVPPRPVLITGATGTLGQAFSRLCRLRGLPHRLVSREEMDIADQDAVGAVLDAEQPWAVVNAAGYARVDDAEREPERCYRDNLHGATSLTAECAARGIPLVTFSSDLVFDGSADQPYTESDPAAPLNVYGRSKARAESKVLKAHPGALVIRTSDFFGPWDDHNFVTQVLRDLAAGRRFEAADDVVVSPTYVLDLVHAALDLLVDGASGIWHLANDGAVTWAELARRAAALGGLDPDLVVGKPHSAFGWAARRPLFSVLGTERGQILPSLDAALQRYFADTGTLGTAADLCTLRGEDAPVQTGVDSSGVDEPGDGLTAGTAATV